MNPDTATQIAKVLSYDYELGLRAEGRTQLEALLQQRHTARLLALTDSPSIGVDK